MDSPAPDLNRLSWWSTWRSPRGRRWALVGLNLALAGVLAGLMFGHARADATFVSAAAAQGPASGVGGGGRSRGQYLMVSGRLNGQSVNAIYVLDSANQEMIALRWERSQNALISLGYRPLAEDIRAGGGGR